MSQHNMKLISTDKLTQEERQKLAVASLKARPTARQRADSHYRRVALERMYNADSRIRANLS
jgi:hypothetical protein